MVCVGRIGVGGGSIDSLQKICMTEDYKPTDNAIAECVNDIFKTEAIYRECRI